MVRSAAFARLGTMLGAAALLGGGAIITGATPVAAAGTLYVSPTGSSGNPDNSCATAKYSTIQSAVNAATAGDTVWVCPGTYAEDVLVQKSLTLQGQSATIDASGRANGMVDTASGTSVSGFTIKGARGEGLAVLPAGVLAGGTPPFPPVKNVRITKNHISYDDTGYVVPTGCAPPLYPGDCGGGLLLDAVANSTISYNVVAHNVDGILLVDDFGPSYGNLITHNVADDNVNECGITLPSHNSSAANVVPQPDGTFKITSLNPTKGGVYDNTVSDNIANGNGTAGFKGNVVGSGAGVLLASAGPGTAVYNNRIIGNSMSGNGLSGVTLHAHYLGGEYLNGNQIEGNFIQTNNTKGDVLDSPFTAADFDTTGILLFSSEPIHTVVSGNTISSDHFGIWATPNVTMTASIPNSFSSVAVPTFIEDIPFGSALFATNVTSSSATLVGLAVANGAPTTTYFEWGTSLPSFNYTVPTSIGSGTSPVGVSASISGLSPSTKYYFQLVLTNSNGTVEGLTQSFTTTS